MNVKIITATVLAIGLAAGGALAQTTSATSKAGSGPNFKSDDERMMDERMMYEENADVMGGFFTDDTMAEIRSDDEVKEIFAALGKEDRDEIKAACERAMESRGSYGTVTVALCEQVDTM